LRKPGLRCARAITLGLNAFNEAATLHAPGG
jgi:hypothetical protein